MLDARDPVFDRVFVDFLARGPARVSWRLRPSFAAPGPHTFRLQAGSTGNPAADDWADCAGPAVGASELVDAVDRSAGRRAATHYRVVLQCAAGTFTSAPAHCFGALALPDWLLARELVRKERLRLRLRAGLDGWLLKRRHVGPGPDLSDPAAAVDPLTGEIRRTRDAGTRGTDRLGGFFAPLPFRLDTGLDAEAGGVDPALQRGSVDDDRPVRGRAVVVPPVAAYDAFVASGSDRRWYVRAVEVRARVRGVPVIADLTLKLAPPTDVLYTIAMPGA